MCLMNKCYSHILVSFELKRQINNKNFTIILKIKFYSESYLLLTSQVKIGSETIICISLNFFDNGINICSLHKLTILHINCISVLKFSDFGQRSRLFTLIIHMKMPVHCESTLKKSIYL